MSHMRPGLSSSEHDEGARSELADQEPLQPAAASGVMQNPEVEPVDISYGHAQRTDSQQRASCYATGNLRVQSHLAESNVGHSQLNHHQVEADPTDFERRYPRDRYGTEAGDNARVWKLYKDRAKVQDDDLFEAWKETLDVLLVFAGLFSAVCTAFLIEAHKLMQPDWEEISARSVYGMWAMAHNVTAIPPNNPDDFQPESHAEWANWLWFTSLSLALVVSLLAILAKQWINQYRSRMRAQVSHRQWVWRHRSFSDGLSIFQLDAIIATLPLLLHISLFAFFAGLSNFLAPSSRGLAETIGVGSAVMFASYILVSLLPIRYPNCPMSTPLVERLHYVGHRVARRVIGRVVPVYSSFRAKVHAYRTATPKPDQSSEERAVAVLHTLAEKGTTDELARDIVDQAGFHEAMLYKGRSILERDASALSWMTLNFRDQQEIRVALDAIGSLHVLQHRRFFPATTLSRIGELAIWSIQGGVSELGTSEEPLWCTLRTALFADRGQFYRETLSLSVWDAGLARRIPLPLYQALFGTVKEVLAMLESLRPWAITSGERDSLAAPFDTASFAHWTLSTCSILLSEDNAALLFPRQLAILMMSVLFLSDRKPDQRLGTRTSTPTNRPADQALTSKFVPEQTLQISRRLPNIANWHYAPVTQYWDGLWVLEALARWSAVLCEDGDLKWDYTPDIQVYRGAYSSLHRQASLIGTTPGWERVALAMKCIGTGHFAHPHLRPDTVLSVLLLLKRVLQTDPNLPAYSNSSSVLFSIVVRCFAYVADHIEPVHRTLHLVPMRDIAINLAYRVGFRFPEITSTVSSAMLLVRPETNVFSLWESVCAVLPTNSEDAILTLADQIVSSLYAHHMRILAVDVEHVHLYEPNMPMSRQHLERHAGIDQLVRLLLLPQRARDLLRRIDWRIRWISSAVWDRLIGVEPPSAPPAAAIFTGSVTPSATSLISVSGTEGEPVITESLRDAAGVQPRVIVGSSAVSAKRRVRFRIESVEATAEASVTH